MAAEIARCPSCHHQWIVQTTVAIQPHPLQAISEWPTAALRSKTTPTFKRHLCIWFIGRTTYSQNGVVVLFPIFV